MDFLLKLIAPFIISLVGLLLYIGLVALWVRFFSRLISEKHNLNRRFKILEFDLKVKHWILVSTLLAFAFIPIAFFTQAIKAFTP